MTPASSALVHHDPTRYCWGETQWGGLWAAVTAVADKEEHSEHSLRRVLCLDRRPPHTHITDHAVEGRVPPTCGGQVVLDGQQRLTTCCVMLAAMRDALRSVVAQTSPVEDLAQRATQAVPLASAEGGESAVAPGALDAMVATLASTLTMPSDSEYGIVLRPTLDDRSDFEAALADASVDIDARSVVDHAAARTACASEPVVACLFSSSHVVGCSTAHPEQVSSLQPAMQLPMSPATATTHGLMRCRFYFDDRLRGLSAARVVALARAALDRLKVTHFPVTDAVQVQAVYEQAALAGATRAGVRLAHARWHVADAMEEAGETGFDALSDTEVLCRYTAYESEDGGKVQVVGVTEEGVTMSPVDLTRNYVLEHFATEVEQIRAHADYWLPIERACCRAGALPAHRNGGGVDGLGDVHDTAVQPLDAADVAAACERGFDLALNHLGVPPLGRDEGGASSGSRDLGSPDPQGSAVAMLVATTQSEVRRRLAIFTRFQQWWDGDGALIGGGYSARLAAFRSAVLTALETA
jgi:hypothetical protein